MCDGDGACPQPDQALSVFERALRKSPRDAVLASRVGQVLVRTHQYGKVGRVLLQVDRVLLQVGRVLLQVDRILLQVGNYCR